MVEKKMRLPDFLFVGAQKAGSTLLYQLLNQHPELHLAQGKGVHFFDRDENYNKAIEWYSEKFCSSKE